MVDVDIDDKLAYFQAITGLEDQELCNDILAAHNWDLELAISSFTSNPNNPPPPPPPNHHHPPPPNHHPPPNPPPTLAWRLVTLPVSVLSGGLGLISGAVGLGVWAVGGLLSYSLSVVGLSSRPSSSLHGEDNNNPLLQGSPSALEAAQFVAAFDRDYGHSSRPMFVAEAFMDALQRSRQEYKLLFVYLHSPDHPDTPLFCETTLCDQALSAFVNHNFVCWGGSIRATEGFKMSNSFKASRFPFCALVMAATNQRIALLLQIEGPKTPEEMVSVLQRVLEETAPVLVSARLEAEERRSNMRLREEQDAAYRAALEADQVINLGLVNDSNVHSLCESVT